MEDIEEIPHFRRKRIMGASPLAVLAIIGSQVLPQNNRTFDPFVHAQTSAETAESSISQSEVSKIIRGYPVVTLNAVGQFSQPLDLAFIGSQNQIVDAFTKLGWVKPDSAANPFALAKSIEIYTKWLNNNKSNNLSYDTMPLSPSFYRPDPKGLPKLATIAFEKQENNSAASRNIIRIWITPSKINGKNLFLASAFYENGFISVLNGFPEHRINPDLDLVRTEIGNDLIKESLVNSSFFVTTLNPTHNQQTGDGNSYNHDGKDQVLVLK